MKTLTPKRVATALAASAFAATGLIGVTGAAGPAPATAQTCTLADDGINGGQLNWGVKQSYRNYILGQVAKGSWSTSDGTGFTGGEVAPDGAFTFPVASGGSADRAQFDGTLRFLGHDYGAGPLLDMTISDITMEIDGNTGYLLVDYVSYESDMVDRTTKGPQITGDNAAIIQIDFDQAPDLTAASTDFSGTARITDEGAGLFLAYEAGVEVDPVSGTLSCAGGSSSGSGGSGSGSGGSGGGRSYAQLQDYTPGLAMTKETYDTLFGLGTLADESLNFLDTAENFYARLYGDGESATVASPIVSGGTTSGGGTVSGGAASGGGAVSGGTVSGGNRVSAGGGAGAAGAGGAGGGTASGTSGGSGGAVTAASAGGSGSGGSGGAGASPTGGSGGGDVCVADGTLGVTEAQARWGVKASFQSYITGNIAKGSWDMSGVGFDNGEFLWVGTSGAVDPGAGTGSVLFPGSLHFSGHAGVLDMDISNLEIQWNGGAGSLIADVVSNDVEGNTTDYGRTTIANLQFSALDVTDSTAAGSASTSLTESGYQAFAQFYEPGTALDPISFTASLGGSANCADGQGGAASGTGVAGGGGDSAATEAARNSGGGAGGTGAAGGASGSGTSASGAGPNGFGDTSSDELFGIEGEGGNRFQIRSTGQDATGSAGGNEFTTSVLLVLAAFVVAGASLSQFVTRNPNA